MSNCSTSDRLSRRAVVQFFAGIGAVGGLALCAQQKIENDETREAMLIRIDGQLSLLASDASRLHQAKGKSELASNTKKMQDTLQQSYKAFSQIRHCHPSQKMNLINCFPRLNKMHHCFLVHHQKFGKNSSINYNEPKQFCRP